MARTIYNENCDLSVMEKEKIERYANELFERGISEAYIPLGKRDVCLKRKDDDRSVFEIFGMNNTLERNEELVTRFNKRKK